jgi:hypothetical protein
MDEYAVKISGPDMDVNQAIQVLDILVVCCITRRGDKNPASRYSESMQKSYSESIISFDYTPLPLLETLKCVVDRKDALTATNVENIEIWGLLQRDRDSQINGELSSEEIQLLANLGASYCWSVL